MSWKWSFVIILFFMTHGIPAQEKQEPYQPTWESLYQHDAAPQWYEDAVLGFYFHWGPYSVPAFGCAGSKVA